MAIHKGPVREQFTQIPNNTHQDTSLSLQARGLLGYIISLPDDWVVRPGHLAKENGIGRNTAYKIINELKESGYIIQVQNRSESGKFSTGDYLVFRSIEDAQWYAETCMNTDVEPCPKKRDAVKRDTVKGQLSNKEIKNKESQSVNNARVISNFADQVMTELLTDNLPANQQRYARMKITEYQERFSGSQSVADCWSYVVTAVNHQISLTGS